MAPTFKDHFSERAAAYASSRPRYGPELAKWLASIAPARRLVWDAGCGSGQLSTLLGDQFDRVIATDASKEQIAQAEPHPHVEYRAEPAEKSSIEDRSADLVTVAQAVHWMNLELFYREVRRVARPDGAIALVAYGIAVIEPVIDKVIDRFYSVDLDGYWPPERGHIETGYRDIPFPFTRIPAPNMDLSVDWSVEQMLGYGRTWSAVRALEKAKGPETTNRFAEALREAWGPRVLTVRWPLVIVAGRVS
jgi:SAM-dependent methyltransferase